MTYTVTVPTTETEAKEHILPLIARNFSAASDDWYDWSFQQNPYGSNSSWLISTAVGDVVGQTTLVPRQMRVGGKSITVGQAAYINVDQQHRTALAAMKLQRALVASVRETSLPFVYGVTETAIPVMQRAGYQVIGAAGRWTRVLRSEYKLRDRIRSKWLRKGAACVVDLGMRLMSAEVGYRRPEELEVCFDDVIDERFDRLWNTSGVPMCLFVERTRCMLQWRFQGEPNNRYKVMTVARSSGQLLAYLVYEIDSCDADGPRAGIHDFYFASFADLDVLLAEFCRHVRQQGVAAISVKYFGNRNVTAALKKFGFLPRPYDWKVLVFVNPGVDWFDANQLFCQDRWHLTDAEFVY